MAHLLSWPPKCRWRRTGRDGCGRGRICDQHATADHKRSRRPRHPHRPRPHLPSTLRFWDGDSIGRWDGNTLIVDVTNYNGKGWIATNAAAGRIKAIPQSDELHVVERFTRADAQTIRYEVTIDDPKVYTWPLKVAIPLNGRTATRFLGCLPRGQPRGRRRAAGRDGRRRVGSANRKGLAMTTRNVGGCGIAVLLMWIGSRCRRRRRASAPSAARSPTLRRGAAGRDRDALQSSGIIGGNQEAVTDERGAFQFIRLVPGRLHRARRSWPASGRPFRRTSSSTPTSTARVDLKLEIGTLVRRHHRHGRIAAARHDLRAEADGAVARGAGQPAEPDRRLGGRAGDPERHR